MADTWRERAIAVIGEVHSSLPDDACLKDRRKALSDARPAEFRMTSWGRKVWGKAARQYLEKHGQKPRASASPPLSPLERMMARSGQ